MTDYHNFIGIDIGKFNFVVATHTDKQTQEYENTSQGIANFIMDYRPVLTQSFCVLETTGGYELTILYSLLSNHFRVHRADTRKVKNFIRSFGGNAKTDDLDAKALAHYGFERHDSLELFKPQTKQDIHLFQLVQRRSDLQGMLIAEKNRFKAPSNDFVKKSIDQSITMLADQLIVLTHEIQLIIDSDPLLKQKQTVLKTIPGIGDIVAFELLILLPELGSLNRKAIASLAGLAPRANDSGRFQGYRRTGHGRRGVKRILFLAAMAARNSKSNLKVFYENLIAKGKKKMVALTALMRKILVIANARLKSCA